MDILILSLMEKYGTYDEIVENLRKVHVYVFSDDLYLYSIETFLCEFAHLAFYMYVKFKYLLKNDAHDSMAKIYASFFKSLIHNTPEFHV